MTYKNHTYTTNSFTLNVSNQWIWVDGYDTTELTIGDTVNLIADIGTYDGDNKTVIWTTSDETVATVNNGVVTTTGLGEVTITATLAKYPNVSWPVVFTVKSPPPTYIGITNIPKGKSLYIGQTHKLAYIITPTNALRDIEWSSSDKAVATINPQTGEIIAKSSGVATITLIAKYEGDVRVTDSIEIDVKNQWIWVDGYFCEELIAGDTVNLIADIGTYDGDNKTVIWTTSDETVATVNNGVVTTTGLGEVTITATLAKYPNVSWPVNFIVKFPSSAYIKITNVDDERLKLNEGAIFQLQHKISGAAFSNEKVVWEVDDEDIAEVTSDGKIIAHKAGNTKITVLVDKDRSVYDTIDLSVCLTKKSYIFYTGYDNEDGFRKETALRDQQTLADKYYGGDISKIEVKIICNASEFKGFWDEMENSLGYVIINLHGTPEGLVQFNHTYSESDFEEINNQLLDPDYVGREPIKNLMNDSFLLNQDIKTLSDKTMNGLILTACNAGHLDYIDTSVGNVAMAFASIVNGAPVMASDGTVAPKINPSNSNENICKSKANDDFQSYSKRVKGVADMRDINDGWIIYQKVASAIVNYAVPESEYEPGDYLYNAKTLTFSKMLELINS